MDRFAQLLVDVDAAFEATSRGLTQWADPHPDRSPLEHEYSRLLDPAKWRIIGARVDAWIEALVAAGLADVEREVAVTWAVEAGTDAHRVDRVVPRRPGSLPLVIAHNRIDGVEGAGVTIAAGDPAVAVETIPDCGCDACDSGSQDVLDQVDDTVGSVVRGEFRHLSRRVRRPPRPPGSWFAARATPADEPTPSEPAFTETWAMPDLETITVISDGMGAASNLTGPRTIAEILTDPTGWTETSGGAWLGDDAT